MTTRELGLVKQTVEEALGLDVSHIYDDLVFIEMGAFLIRFDNTTPGKIHLHFEQDCDPEARPVMLKMLNERASANKLDLVSAEDFFIKEVPGKDELQVNFLE